MKTNESPKGNVTLRFFGIGLLGVLWLGLVVYIFTVTGINLKNILLAAMSGFIVFYPLWRKYISPIFEQRK